MDCIGVPWGRCAFHGATGTCTTVSYEEALDHALRIGGAGTDEAWINEQYPPKEPHSACKLMTDLGLAQNRSLDGIDHRWVARERFNGHTLPVTDTGNFLKLRWMGAFGFLMSGPVYFLEDSEVDVWTLPKLHAIFDALDRYFFDGTLGSFLNRTWTPLRGDLFGFLKIVRTTGSDGEYAYTDSHGGLPGITFNTGSFSSFPDVNQEEYPEFPLNPDTPFRRLVLAIMRTMAHEIVHALVQEDELCPDHGPLFHRLSYWIFGAHQPHLSGVDVDYRARLAPSGRTLRPGFGERTPILTLSAPEAQYERAQRNTKLLQTLAFKLNLAYSLAQGRPQARVFGQLAPIVRDIATALESLVAADASAFPPHVRAVLGFPVSGVPPDPKSAALELEAIPGEVMATRRDLAALRSLLHPEGLFLRINRNKWVTVEQGAQRLENWLDAHLDYLKFRM